MSGMSSAIPLAKVLAAQVTALHAAQTAPYELLVSDYTALLRRNRELEVYLCYKCASEKA